MDTYGHPINSQFVVLKRACWSMMVKSTKTIVVSVNFQAMSHIVYFKYVCVFSTTCPTQSWDIPGGRWTSYWLSMFWICFFCSFVVIIIVILLLLLRLLLLLLLALPLLVIVLLDFLLLFHFLLVHHLLLVIIVFLYLLCLCFFVFFVFMDILLLRLLLLLLRPLCLVFLFFSSFYLIHPQCEHKNTIQQHKTGKIGTHGQYW